MRVLALDFGTKTMGIAISDSLKIIASGLENFEYQNNDFQICINKIKEIFIKYQDDIDTIILGYPLNVNGSKNERTILVEKFNDLLKQNFPNQKVILVDERYTTRIATWQLKSINVKSSKIKQVKDKMSAVIILQFFLDKR